MCTAGGVKGVTCVFLFCFFFLVFRSLLLAWHRRAEGGGEEGRVCRQENRRSFFLLVLQW